MKNEPEGFQCPECSQWHRTRDNLKMHRGWAHPEYLERELEQVVIRRAIRAKVDLDHHQRQSVWVVYYGNAFPREVDSVWLTRDGAERRASILVSFRVEEWPVGERIGVDD